MQLTPISQITFGRAVSTRPVQVRSRSVISLFWHVKVRTATERLFVVVSLPVLQFFRKEGYLSKPKLDLNREAWMKGRISLNRPCPQVPGMETCSEWGPCRAEQSTGAIKTLPASSGDGNRSGGQEEAGAKARDRAETWQHVHFVSWIIIIFQYSSSCSSIVY